MGDLLGSVAALGAGVTIALTGWTPIDPILSLVISLLILLSTVRLLSEGLHVVMEGVPAHIDLPEVGRALASIEGIEEVHDLHIWTLASGSHSLSAHVRLCSLAKWPEQLAEIERLMSRRYGVEHITVQPELAPEICAVPLSQIQRIRPAGNGDDEPGRR
jgi:cobalt-zinc-cadmium efflux system protein